MIKFFQSRIYRDLKDLCTRHQKKIPVVGAVAFCFLVYCVSKIASQGTTHIYHHDAQTNFRDAHVFGRQAETLADRKDMLFSKTVKEIVAAQASTKQGLDALQGKFEAWEK